MENKKITLSDTGEKLLDLMTDKIEEYRKKNGPMGWYHWNKDNWDALVRPYIKAFEEKITEKLKTN